ncbi:MAG: holo-ACP synthase [Solirubrobacteraceae bacterium]
MTDQPAAQAAVGIDLLEIDRLERALARRPRLAERLFTESERAYAAARGRPAQHLAARFCAKEAVAKALGLQTWSFRDVEVVAGDGPPTIRLHGGASARAAALGVVVRVSLTHTRRDAGAVALAATLREPLGGVVTGPDRATTPCVTRPDRATAP